MSAVQSIPFPVTRQSAADLLASAAKSAKPGKLTCTDEFAQQQAAHWLRLDRQVKELTREQELTRDALIDAVRPFHEETCKRRRTYEASVQVESELGNVRVSFQNRWVKMNPAVEPDLREALNGGNVSYDTLFRRHVSVKIRKDIAEDAEALNAVVMELANALGAERFREVFEVEQNLQPTKIYTETQYNLSEHVRNVCGLAGVRQVVAVAKGGER